MRHFKNVIALLVAATMVCSVVACSKKQGDATGESTAVASETQASAADKQTFEDIYGNQLPAYLNHQYYFEGNAIPLTESNYYFIQAFSDLCNYAMYYGLPQTPDGLIDLSAEYVSDNPDEPDMQTWGDFFVEYAETQLLNTCVMNKLAQERGIKLDDADMADIEGFFDDIQKNVIDVDDTGITMDEYLKLNFGDACTKEELSNVLSHMKIAERYMADYAKTYEFNEEDIMIPNIRYALFYLEPDATEEEIAAQQAECEKMLAACTSLDVFDVEGGIGQANGSVYEYGPEIAVPKGQMVPEFEAWAYDESREVGDIEMIRTEAYGFFIVGYLGLTEVSDDVKASIAMKALNSEMQEKIADGSYKVTCDESFEPAPVATTPAPTYEHVTVIRDGEEYPSKDSIVEKDYSKTIIIAVLAVAAGGIGGAGIYGSIMKNKEKKERKAKK